MPLYDVLIAGAGPAGLSAALMLGRCRRRVLVCDLGTPRNRRSAALHGYLTRDGVPPLEFNAIGRRELAKYGIEVRMIGVMSVVRTARGFDATLSDGRKVRSCFLLVATGVCDTLPAIDGIAACYGRSVFHCPYCDGWEWRDRRLAVVGPRSGVGLALSLLTWSADIIYFADGKRVSPNDRELLRRNKIRLLPDRLDRIEHRDGRLRAIVFRDGRRERRDAVFFSGTQQPQVQLAESLGCALTRHGTVKTGTLSDTNVPGVFAAGDASRDAQLVVVAAAEGAKAGMAINQQLQRMGLRQGS